MPRIIAFLVRAWTSRCYSSSTVPTSNMAQVSPWTPSLVGGDVDVDDRPREGTVVRDAVADHLVDRTDRLGKPMYPRARRVGVANDDVLVSGQSKLVRRDAGGDSRRDRVDRAGRDASASRIRAVRRTSRRARPVRGRRGTCTQGVPMCSGTARIGETLPGVAFPAARGVPALMLPLVSSNRSCSCRVQEPPGAHGCHVVARRVAEAPAQLAGQCWGRSVSSPCRDQTRT